MFYLGFSKGDWVRPVNKKRFDKNFEDAFGERPLKTWNPEEDDELKDNGGTPMDSCKTKIRTPREPGCVLGEGIKGCGSVSEGQCEDQSVDQGDCE